MEIGQALLQAPFGDLADWDAPLRQFAEISGSCQAQLLGTSHAARGQEAILFHCLTDPRPGALEDCLTIGGEHADVNWKLQMRSPVLEIIDESEYRQLDDARNSRNIFTQYLQDYKGYHGSHITLIDDGDAQFTLALLRDRPSTPESLEILRAITPYAHSAALLQRSIEAKGYAIAADTLEALDVPVLLLDRSNQVQAMTRQAAGIVTTGALLDMKNSRMRAAQPAADKRLQAALRSVQSGQPYQRVVLRHDLDMADDLIVEIFALPRREWSFGFEPRTLVTLKAPRDVRADQRGALAEFFELTEAEGDVAVQLAMGLSRKEIAARRQSSPETVATQIKTIFRKAGVSREGEFVSLAKNI